MKVLEKDFNSNILHVGCGNSKLGRLLHDAGFVNAAWLHQFFMVVIVGKLFLPHVCPRSSGSL